MYFSDRDIDVNSYKIDIFVFCLTCSPEKKENYVLNFCMVGFY